MTSGSADREIIFSRQARRELAAAVRWYETGRNHSTSTSVASPKRRPWVPTLLALALGSAGIAGCSSVSANPARTPEAEPVATEPAQTGSGGADTDEIDTVAREARTATKRSVSRMWHCYEAYLQRSGREPGGRDGRVELRIVGDADGRVRNARLERSTFRDARMEECFVRTARALRFPQLSAYGTYLYAVKFSVAGAYASPLRPAPP
jgi:hypothetical protein